MLHVCSLVFVCTVQLCLLAKCMKPALQFLDVDITDISKEVCHLLSMSFVFSGLESVMFPYIHCPVIKCLESLTCPTETRTNVHRGP